MENHGLSKEEIERALKFEGYGNKSAPFWFIGMEEGGGSIGELRQRVRQYDSVEYLHSAPAKIGSDTRFLYVPTWRVMSKLAMALQGEPDWRETSSARDYQANRLGRPDGDTFLTELMPLPCRNIVAWPYKSLFPTKIDYHEKVRPGRIRWLRSEISAARSPFVICYGKGNWPYYNEIFSDVELWSEPIENVLIGQPEHGTIILTRFLSPDLVSTALIEQIADRFGQNRNQN